jgi:hypothetical protein
LALEALWSGSAGDPADTAAVRWQGPRHVLPSIFDVTEAAAVSVTAARLAAARFMADRNGSTLPALDADRRHAAIAFRSERYLRVGGSPLPTRDPISGDYPTADGRWIRLHASFPAHRVAACGVLGVTPKRQRVAEAVATRDAETLESDVQAAGGCAAMRRSVNEWRALPQGNVLPRLTPVEIETIGPAAPRDVAKATRPLEGIRVLDLTRVIAGPVCGRFLAACGADVLRVKSPHLPDIEALAIDTGLGKREAVLDLHAPSDRAAFVRLVADADVVVQSYRPGAHDRHGQYAARQTPQPPRLVTADL